MPSKSETQHARRVAVIGAGPAGLMAAEVLAKAGHKVEVFDRMPSPARKLLMAGRGGLNLTHSKSLQTLLDRYGPSRGDLAIAIEAFAPASLTQWAEGLGQETFVGSSGRIFPKSMKASPLVRAWLARLDSFGVVLHMRHRWLGWDDTGGLQFTRPDGSTLNFKPDATILALGGASWPRLGSDGHWTSILEHHGVTITPLQASNAGVLISWSDAFRGRFEGTPLKRIAVTAGGEVHRGEAVVTRSGLEGNAIYACSRSLREEMRTGNADVQIHIDLRPDTDIATLVRALSAPRGKQSTSNFLRKSAGLSPAGVALLREPGQGALPETPMQLAMLIKALPLRVAGLAGLERAISTAGGIPFSQLEGGTMLKVRPGVFVAGEMLDWDAPTGGYLLQAAFATAVAAAEATKTWLARTAASSPAV